ncbi:MAG: hypothetical protein FGM52_06660 [Mycobacterium sp.]|nr:hypothetical protein [Mycobacterium sp.]
MPRRGGRLILMGLAIAAFAVLGWLITVIATGWISHPKTTEDLTGVWSAAERTPLGETTTVSVPPGQTLVAFLVGTDLGSIAGTTSGSCTATSAGSPVELSWPVLLNHAVEARKTDGLERVATAGWTNHTGSASVVDISCTTADSTVRYFVALPSRTAALVDPPWFQPGGWVALGAVGAALITAGLLALRR